jgi:hypothetical protein
VKAAAFKKGEIAWRRGISEFKQQPGFSDPGLSHNSQYLTRTSERLIPSIPNGSH